MQLQITERMSAAKVQEKRVECMKIALNEEVRYHYRQWHRIDNIKTQSEKKDR